MKKILTENLLNFQHEVDGFICLCFSMIQITHLIQLASASLGLVSIGYGFYKKLKK